MSEITCPNCGKVFQIDEASYAQIVKQVRDNQFKSELQEREKSFSSEKDSAVKLAKAETEKDYEGKLSEMQLKLEQLTAQLNNAETSKQLAVEKEKTNQQNELNDKTLEIEKLRTQLEAKEKAFLEKENDIKDSYERQLKSKDEQIAYYKDFKMKQSTKMIGESLEQHCLNEFNRLRATGFQRAYFEKDNDSRSGSKGDFIFRDYDEEGLEYVSIMFEMKNEADETKTKHKNEDFFKELDKDRKEKGCEYAVLVSLLESDSEYYNTGIVDVSYKYEKMYVIRPQFFIPLITILRNSALNSLEYKQELQVIRNQNIDITHFEENMETFKNAFARNYELASRQFETAIEEIDKSIDHLNKIKTYLTKSENNLRLANQKADDLTIKKLTANSPTMAEKFAQLNSANESTE